ncbi:MAG: hypothetical protein KGJ13_09645 [Patescibacteria group bacterium]|nr:hypothetical protein [Patescibacteria group bacterium]
MSHQQKIEKAIVYLGPRWICHPSRRIERLKEAQQSDIHKADVAATIKRVRKAMEREAQA